MSTADNAHPHGRKPTRQSSEKPHGKGETGKTNAQRPNSKSAGRAAKGPPAAVLAPGTVEEEMGVPIPGVILAPEAWANTAIKRLPEGTWNFAEIFGRNSPIAIDIGCGNGRFVLSSAVRRPDWDHVAIDILPMVIRYATRRANQRGLSNCRFAACDGSRMLSQHCGASSVDEIHIYHPQPYSDSERQHLRLLTPEFMALVHRVLRPHGKLFLQTDNPAYWEYFKPLVSATMQWHDQSGPWPEDPYGRSRREFLAIEQGLSIYRGWAQRRDDLSETAMAELTQQLPQPTFTIENSPNQASRKDRRRGNWRGGRRRR